MALSRLAIIGVGLMGGAIGLAVRKRRLAHMVVGAGRTRGGLEKAYQIGALDKIANSIEESVRGADLVVICVPVGRIAEVVRRIVPEMSPGAILTDVGSAKARVVEQVAPLCGERVRFVGSHPLIGSEKKGAEAAHELSFEGSTCVLTPTADSSPEALERVGRFWRDLGCATVTLSPEEHDRLLALASHLPHVAASCLVNVQTLESLRLASTGFGSVTRPASGDPEIWTDVCLANSRPIAEALRAYAEELLRVAGAVERGDGEDLRSALAEAKRRRESPAG